MASLRTGRSESLPRAMLTMKPLFFFMPSPILRLSCPDRSSVLEVSPSREYHCHAVFIGRLDGFLVPDGTTGLDHSRYAGGRRRVDDVAEWEKGIGGKDGAFRREVGLHQGYLQRIDATHLAGTHADELVLGGDHDGIRLDVLHDTPGETSRPRIQSSVGCVR